VHVPRSSPYEINLSLEERRILVARARKYTLLYRDVFRAGLNTRREIVSKWRKRFLEERLEGLEERARAGRSRVFSP
jgi:hypothetical protein